MLAFSLSLYRYGRVTQKRKIFARYGVSFAPVVNSFFAEHGNGVDTEDAHYSQSFCYGISAISYP